MLRDVPSGTALCRPFSLRAALTLAAFACATAFSCISFSFAQSPGTTPPAPAPADAQQTAPAEQAAPTADAQQSTQTPAAEPAKAADPSKPDEHADAPTAEELHDAAVTEDQLRQQLTGKTFYLRGLYLDNNLHFNQKGELDGSSPTTSYTLSLVEIDHIKVDKRHVELDGVRYGLHFLGALPSQDQEGNVDRVKLTSKKKPLKITIDREIVVAPKKQKPAKEDKRKGKLAPQTAAQSSAMAAALPTTAVPAAEAPTQTPAALAQTQAAPVVKETEMSRHGVTTSKKEADRMLGKAIDQIFAASIDDRMVATFPDYWKLYYKAVADKVNYKPGDPTIPKSNQVDKKPQLLMSFEPPSNEYAQNNGVAGMAMYHVIVGADGKPQEIAVGRPIGFGLDENAVDSIRKASFVPGMKDGKAVPVEVDLTVQFRIYSKRTAAGSGETAKVDPTVPKATALPGPYSVSQPPQ
jgi:TonB family protein